MMDTILNLGLNDRTVEVLAASADKRFAYDSYRRFIQMYSDVVLGIDHHRFEERLEDFKDERGYTLDTELTGDDWSELVRDYKVIVQRERGTPFPEDPKAQLWGAIGAVFQSWMNQRAITYRRLHNHPRGLGHRGQRPGHGVRQHGRHLGDRRRLHPQPLDRREGASTASSCSTPRARTWSPAPARRRT